MTKYKTIEDFKDQIPEGATHYANETSDDHFAFFKVANGVVCINVPKYQSDWVKADYDSIGEIENLIALTPVKQPKFKYVQVDEFSFDLKDEFEAGELYYQLPGNSAEYWFIEDLDSLIGEFTDCNLYRRVELTEEDEIFNVLKELQLKEQTENPGATLFDVMKAIAKSGKLQLT